MATTPIYDLTDTWDVTANTFTGIKLNATDTASNAASLLMDLQVGSASKFQVTKAGRLAAGSGYAYGLPQFYDSTFGTQAGFQIATTGACAIYGSGNAAFALENNATVGIRIAGALPLGWVDGHALATSSDLRLFRDAANTLAQRNGANAQTTRVYSTYTAADNFQRLAITSASVTLSALSGASVTATGLIPAGAVVMGVTSRVSTLITGADGYQIGTGADADRWADKTGVAVGTTTDNRDWTAGTIENFAAATDVIVTAKTANFTAGAIVVTVHYLAGQAD